MAGAEVYATGAGMPRFLGAKTDADGRFEITGFRPGSVAVEIWSPRHLWFKETVGIAEGTTRRTFRLRRGTLVRFLVRDGAGNRRARVPLVAAPLDDEDRHPVDGRTDSLGVCERRLPAGRWEARIPKGDTILLRREFVVRETDDELVVPLTRPE